MLYCLELLHSAVDFGDEAEAFQTLGYPVLAVQEVGPLDHKQQSDHKHHYERD